MRAYNLRLSAGNPKVAVLVNIIGKTVSAVARVSWASQKLNSQV